jgi:hypothetical protein
VAEPQRDHRAVNPISRRSMAMVCLRR